MTELTPKDLSLDVKTFKKDKGVAGAENIVRAVEYCGDEKVSLESRIKMAAALKNYASMVPMETKLSPFQDACEQFVETAIKLFRAPDDEENNDGAFGYDKKGNHSLTAKFCAAFASVNIRPMEVEWNIFFMKYAFQVLDAVADLELETRSAMNPRGPKISKAEAVQKLIRAAPSSAVAMQGKWTIGDVDDPVSTLRKYIDNPNTPKTILMGCNQLLNCILKYDKSKAANAGPMAQSVIDRVLSGDMQAPRQLTMDMYKEEPEVFHKHFADLLNAQFLQCSNLCMQIAKANPQAIAQHVPMLVQLFTSGAIQHDMDSMIFQFLHPIAQASPEVVFPHVATLENRSYEAKNCDGVFLMLLGYVGQGDPDRADASVRRIGGALQTMRMTSQSVPMALHSMLNLIPVISSTKVLEPFMDSIRAQRGVAAQAVEKIEDAYQGRSLANAYDRLDKLDKMVAQMNDKVSQTCANFDEVKAYVDKNIAEVKDFVAEVVKKLPQPVKLTVVKGLRKTIRLHFACVRTGAEWTCDTKAWGKWMKMGFSLIKLGKCALDIGMGNPLGLVKTGIDACKGIYNAFKEKDDKDFDTYIQQPFLTSEERDKLINQLRDGGFFVQFAYDAQAGGWVSLKHVTPAEAAKLVAKRDKNKPGADAKVTVKGKNFGLGSAKDMVAAAGAVVRKAGLGGAVSSHVGGGADAVLEMAGVDEKVAEKVANKAGDVAESKLASEDDPAQVSYSTSGPPLPPVEKASSSSATTSSAVPMASPVSGAVAAATAVVVNEASLVQRITQLEATVAYNEGCIEELQKTVAELKKQGPGAQSKCCVVM